MRHLLFSAILIAPMLYPMSIFAVGLGNDFNINKLNYCAITQPKYNDYEPNSFISNNNLLRKAGQVALYEGNKIIVTGKILAANCAPVADAKIYIWQVNSKGLYPYKALKTSINQKMFDPNNDEDSFTGNGIATTNNNGRFYFITIVPKAVHKLPSHINVRVKHYSLGMIDTRLLINQSNLAINPLDNPDLLHLSNLIKMQNTSIPIYDYQIVMPLVGMDEY